LAEDKEYLISIIQVFYNKMKTTTEEKMYNFKEKTAESEIIVENFFQNEIEKIDKISKDLVLLIEGLTVKVKKLIALYQIKFKEQFKSVREEFEEFDNNLKDSKIFNNLVNKMINKFKNSDAEIRQRFMDLKNFRVKKKELEKEHKRLLGFYEFNKSALISEFSVVKDFSTLLEENENYLNKHLEEYNSKISMNINEKIHNVLYSDNSQSNFCKNYLPKNISKIYQPIDRTNQLNIYDVENEYFNRVNLNFEKLHGFAFTPFSRYINYNGKLIISGGYGEKGQVSKSVFIIEEKESFYKAIDSKGKRSSRLVEEFYNNLNKEAIYEDYHNEYILLKAGEMIYPRAGHAMVAGNTGIVYAISGAEGNETCEFYSLDTNKWEEFANVNQHRIDPSACLYKNYLYAFFGLLYNKHTRKYSFLDIIERISTINVQKKEWEIINLKVEILLKDLVPRSLCGIVIKNENSDCIYLLGGQKDKEEFSNDIFEFNFVDNTIVLSEKKLPKPSAFLEQNFLYCFKTGITFDLYGDMFYYNSSSDSFNFYYQKLNEK
jgi:hypothetical protein